MRPIVIVSILILMTLASFQNCSVDKFASQETPIENPSKLEENYVCYFNRKGLKENETVKAYRTSTVPAGQQCESELRRCQNGSLLTGTFQFAFCVPGAPTACLIQGQTIGHGSGVKFYQVATVPYGSRGADACEAKTEMRMCNNGELSGSFTERTCVEALASDCLLNGETIRHGGRSNLVYKDAVVPYNENCVSEVRTCTNGNLSGSFTNKECRKETALNCTVNGFNFNHGTSEPFFDRTTVPYGSTCPAAVSRSCTNGQVSEPATHIYRTCTAGPPANCSLNGVTVDHGDPVGRKFYKDEVVPYGQSCEAPANIEMRKCTNGSLSGSYTKTGCTVAEPTIPCTTTDGVSLNAKSTTNLYKTVQIRAPDTCATVASVSNVESVYCDNGTMKVGSQTGAPVVGSRYANCPLPTETGEYLGGMGGGPFAAPFGCASGVSADGFAVWAGNPYLESVRLTCGGVATAKYGGKHGSVNSTKVCPSPKKFVGLIGQFAPYINYVIPVCANEDGTGIFNLVHDGHDLTSTYYGSGARWFGSVCKPGWIVNTLDGRSGDVVDGLQLSCVKVTEGANLDCIGDWRDEGCTGDFYPSSTLRFIIQRHKGGNGAACPTANGAIKAGSGNCFVPDPGGGGPGDG